MVLEVFWTNFSIKQLREISRYYEEEAGINVAKAIVIGIIEKAETLESFPERGQKEELLSDRPQYFRYLVYKNYKIIYWINKKKGRIDITDVFDSRQNPIKLRRNIK